MKPLYIIRSHPLFFVIAAKWLHDAQNILLRLLTMADTHHETLRNQYEIKRKLIAFCMAFMVAKYH